MGFPMDFTWGVSSASYQIEGSPLRAGGGKSVWDMFCEREGAIFNGESGWIACDHYERYREDVALMRELGLQGYRFSLSWPRILPDGVGKVNEVGLGFYDKLVDELLAKGITPWATLFHWDYPYALFNRGGWLNADSPKWFADYAELAVGRLGDRVRHWMTLNEPQCFIGLGHVQGIHAPGEKMQLTQALLAGHNALLAHGLGVQAIRSNTRVAGTLVGFAPAIAAYTPASDSPADIEATRMATSAVALDPLARSPLWSNSWWMDPVFRGSYPSEGLDKLGKSAPEIKSGDMETIYQPVDFCGANIYQSTLIKAGAGGAPETQSHPPGTGRSAFGWALTPESLYWSPKFFWERYGKPIVITENGMAGTDWLHVDGKVHDAPRIDFVNRYLREFRRAHDEAGVAIQGYFHWTFTDNFEWAEGTKQRFGMVYTDYATQKRIPKDSAYWYKSVIETNGANL